MAKKETPAWWREKVGHLQEQAVAFKEIYPDEFYPKSGCWPLIKLVVMKYALGFYCPIMRKAKGRKNIDSIHFIDLCAGSGLTQVRPARNSDKSITVTGSALIGAHEETFDHYHFVEPRKGAAQALEARLQVGLDAEDYTVYNVSRDVAVEKIRDLLELNRNPHYMAFVDPEGFTEITLPQLEPLLGSRRGDLLFNYQYMGVKRAPDAASQFFGVDTWPKDATTEQVRQFLPTRLRYYGRPAVKSMNIVSGVGPYSYDLVYAARETAAGNPWLQNFEMEISRRTDRIDGKTVCNWVFGGQQSLFQ